MLRVSCGLESGLCLPFVLIDCMAHFRTELNTELGLCIFFVLFDCLAHSETELNPRGQQKTSQHLISLTKKWTFTLVSIPGV